MRCGVGAGLRTACSHCRDASAERLGVDAELMYQAVPARSTASVLTNGEPCTVANTCWKSARLRGRISPRYWATMAELPRLGSLIAIAVVALHAKPGREITGPW